MIMNSAVAVILPYFTEIAIFGVNYVTMVEVRPMLSAKIPKI